MSLRNQVFISYAREDAHWRDVFVTMLAPAIERGCIDLWSDAKIPVGDNWSRSIDEALSSAAAGLLLVTPAFLASEFVTTVELPRLLNLAMARSIPIWWVPIAPSLYTETPLRDVQAAWTPSRPLEGLSKADRDAAVQQICTQMVEDFGFLPKVSEGRRRRLSSELGATLYAVVPLPILTVVAAAASVVSMSSWAPMSLMIVPGSITPGQRIIIGTR